MTTKSCASCGGKAMTQDIRDVTTPYRGGSVTVRAVTGWHCNDCGETEFISSSEARRYAEEAKAAMHAIDTRIAAELRATRKRLGLKQAEAAAIFGGGVNAFSEYERGIRQPSKSTVLLMKLLERHPELLEEVRSSAR